MFAFISFPLSTDRNALSNGSPVVFAFNIILLSSTRRSVTLTKSVFPKTVTFPSTLQFPCTVVVPPIFISFAIPTPPLTMSAPEIESLDCVIFAIVVIPNDVVCPPIFKLSLIPTPPSTTNAPVSVEVELVVPVTRVSPIKEPSRLPVIRPDADKKVTDELP